MGTKFDTVMTAITFAEAGEWETARTYLPRINAFKISVTHLLTCVFIFII